MRRAWVACIVVGVLAAALAATIAGCEDEEQQQQAASTQPEGPSQPQFQPLKLATQPATLPMPPAGWTPTTEPDLSTTGPTTRGAATAAAGTTTEPTVSYAADPLDDPEAAVRHFFELCARKDLPDLREMRAMIVEPPSDDELAVILDKVRIRLRRGATWEIIQTHKRGGSAIVLYKSTLRGRTLAGDIKLYQGRDDRWRIIVGDLTPSRYTTGEKNAMSLEAAWARERLAEINAELAASRPATTQPAASPSTSPSAQ